MWGLGRVQALGATVKAAVTPPETPERTPVVDELPDDYLEADDIDVETALAVIDALDEILDDGDWWRLERGAQERASSRSGKYAYTKQDWAVYKKLKRLNEVRTAQGQYERLAERFAEHAD